MKSLQEFSVSHRSYSSMVIFATLSASFIGGGFSIGNAEKVFSLGIVSIVALWGFSLKEILVAKFIAPRTCNFPNVISTGDIMERGYGKAAKVVTGFFSVLLCAGIVGAQVGGHGIYLLQVSRHQTGLGHLDWLQYCNHILNGWLDAGGSVNGHHPVLRACH